MMTKGNPMKEFIRAHSSRRVRVHQDREVWWEAAGAESTEIPSSTTKMKQRERTGSGVRLSTPKASPTNVLPPARLYLLKIP